MEIKKILQKNNFKFEKKYGQNFLTDDELLSSIVSRSGVDENSVVVEIGVGAGTLTRQIAKKVKKVYGFEIDNNLKPILNETLSEFSNVELIFGDIMKTSVLELEQKIGGNYTVIANLPYYITTPLIMRFVEDSTLCDAVVVTVQKEVAERLSAKAGTSDYGAITVSVNAVADSQIIEYIYRDMFYPAPNVDSAVVKTVFNRKKFDGVDLVFLRKIIKCAFTMRRKTLVNNLVKDFSISREIAEKCLTECGVSTGVRGEALDVLDFVNLSKILVKYI